MDQAARACQSGIILLVEDNPDDVELTLRAFRKTKLADAIAVVRDGAEALDYLFATGTYAHRNTSDLPRVVLLDLHLPKIDGLGVLQRLRADERLRCLPVVMLTSSTADEDIVRSYRLGANSFVRKPVDFEQFLEAVRQLGVYWSELNCAPPAVAAALSPPVHAADGKG